MVITYEDSEKAVRALYALRESKYEDKHLLGKIIILVICTTKNYDYLVVVCSDGFYQIDRKKNINYQVTF